jgi:hypothetical protein
VTELDPPDVGKAFADLWFGPGRASQDVFLGARSGVRLDKAQRNGACGVLRPTLLSVRDIKAGDVLCVRTNTARTVKLTVEASDRQAGVRRLRVIVNAQ